MSLAAETNAKPLPAVPEVFGLRHPPESECLTHVDFDLVPNRPPPDVKAWDEVLEEVEEPSDDEEAEEEEEEEELAEDMVAPARRARASTSQSEDTYMGDASSAPGEVPASGNHTPDVEMRGTPVDAGPTGADEDDEDDGLFGGDDDEMSADEAPPPPPTMQRKLVEEDDYD
jgi:transcription initiation factor TFIID subunit 9B